MESMMFRVVDEFGHLICETEIPWGELYLLKKYILCEVEYGTVVWY